MSTTTDYQQQAIDFLNQTSTAFTVSFKNHGLYFSDENEKRDIYTIVLKNKLHRYRFTFGQSVYMSKERIKASIAGKSVKLFFPTAYDVLACLTKYKVGTFENFCSDYGYDVDSRKAYKTYKAVLREWKNVELLFTPEQIELLQEIN